MTTHQKVIFSNVLNTPNNYDNRCIIYYLATIVVNLT